ncbi:hypothetical protein QL285_014584 [Trifolium repens]|nr:hypothetical protein QL285_014584 [Trifolium repens]
MLQFVEPPKIPRYVRSQAILREDGGHSGGRRVVKLVELSKKAGDSGAQALLQEGTKLATPESEEEAVNLVGATCSGLENHFHFYSMKSPLTFIYPMRGKENITKTFGFGSGVGYARGRC